MLCITMVYKTKKKKKKMLFYYLHQADQHPKRRLELSSPTTAFWKIHQLIGIHHT